MERRHVLTGLATGGLAASLGGFCVADVRPLVVPIAVTPSRRIVTSVAIGPHGPFYFMVDTGAFISGIKPSLAKRLGMRSVANQKTKGVGGAAYTTIFHAKDVVFGESFRLADMAMAGFAAFETSEFDGLLAAGFLTGATSRLDFETLSISFYPGAEPVDLVDYHLWPSLRQQEGSGEKIYVDVEIEGNMAHCLLDTGFRSAVNLASDFVRKHKLWDKYPRFEDRVSTGIHGDKVKTRYTHANSIEIGGFPIKGGPLTLYDPKAREDFGGCDGVVGMGAIGRFNHVFTADGLFVKPNKYFEDVQILFGKPSG